MSKYLVSLFLLTSGFAFCGDVGGKIQVVTVHTHPGWGGVMIQMADGKVVDPQCGNKSWALIKVENELDKALVSAAITAQTTQQYVRVFTSTCSNPPSTLGTIPIVQAIDLGKR